MGASKEAITITELVRRLNHLPQGVHQTTEVSVEEGTDSVVVTIPMTAFNSDPNDVRSLLLPEGGIHGAPQA